MYVGSPLMVPEPDSEVRTKAVTSAAAAAAAPSQLDAHQELASYLGADPNSFQSICNPADLHKAVAKLV